MKTHFSIDQSLNLAALMIKSSLDSNHKPRTLMFQHVPFAQQAGESGVHPFSLQLQVVAVGAGGFEVVGHKKNVGEGDVE